MEESRTERKVYTAFTVKHMVHAAGCQGTFQHTFGQCSLHYTHVRAGHTYTYYGVSLSTNPTLDNYCSGVHGGKACLRKSLYYISGDEVT